MVGAGPAGNTVARYVARSGHTVLILDRRREIGSPVQCGEFVAHNEEIRSIFPKVDGLDELMRIPDDHRRREIDLIQIFSPGGKSWEIPFKGYTINRDQFDKLLVAIARDEGAELRTGVRVEGVKGDEVKTDRGILKGRVIVGADGPFSTVARSVGLPSPLGLAPAVTTQVEGEFEPVVKMYFGKVAPGGYAWIIPKDGRANVGLGVWERFDGNISRLLGKFMEMKGLTGTRVVGGWVPTCGPVERTVKRNVLLVGDAAGHVMPTNGGGINLAMICGREAAVAVSEHLEKGTPLTSYEERWRELVGEPLQIGARVKALADRFFGSDLLLGLAMHIMGRRRMGKAIRCQNPFP